MEIAYRIEDDLDWRSAEEIFMEPEGWKPVRVSFIDAYPYLFWRINDIPQNFRSSSDAVATKGVHEFFSENLHVLRVMVLGSIDQMPEERRKFYEENIMELFNE
jgi:hypothetical protein